MMLPGKKDKLPTRVSCVPKPTSLTIIILFYRLGDTAQHACVPCGRCAVTECMEDDRED